MKRFIPLALLLGLCGLGLSLHAEEAAKKTSKPKPPAVIPPDVNGYKTIIAPPVNAKPVKVAIYDGGGSSKSGQDSVKTAVASIPGSEATFISPADMGTTDLKAYDVVVFCGGSGSAQSKAIGEAGLNNVREFVRGGGGYVGICAGAYLACANYDWSLGILNASTVSSKWQRGAGFLDLEVTESGHAMLGDVKGTFKVRYHNGPIIKPADRAGLPAYVPVTLFRAEVAENNTPVGVMINSPAQATGLFGQGRVFISSPHPENTPGLEHLIPRALLWAAGQEPQDKKETAVP